MPKFALKQQKVLSTAAVLLLFSSLIEFSSQGGFRVPISQKAVTETYNTENPLHYSRFAYQKKQIKQLRQSPLRNYVESKLNPLNFPFLKTGSILIRLLLDGFTAVSEFF